MNEFVFGIENYCKVKFIGNDNDPKKYYWFSNIERVMLKNGFGIEGIINDYGHGSVKEIFDINGVNNYFSLEYDGKIRYFKNLNLSTYIINKHELSKYFRPVDELISENKKFLFIIDSGDYMSINKIHLSDKILKLAKDRKCKIVLNTSYEPYSQEQAEFIEILDNFALKYDLNSDILKIISGNLVVKNEESKPYEFIPYCYFLENPWFVAKDVFHSSKYYEEGQKKISESFKLKREQYLRINGEIKKFEKKILCYNRRPHPHRRFLFYKLHFNSLINKNSYLSLNNTDNVVKYSYNYLYNISIEESNRMNDFYMSNVKMWSFDLNNLNINLANNFDEYYHKKTFVSLVSETSVVPGVVFFSEKIFKPIYACQPFILSGNSNSLEKLKELGFKTFDRWWDESYDREERYEKRLEKITRILEDICKMSDAELISILAEMEDVLLHNYNVFVNANNEYLINTFNSIKF